MLDLVLAVVMDLILGDPYWLPHPVRLMGRLIAAEEKLVRKLVKSDKGLMAGGFFIVAINLPLAFGVPYTILSLLRGYGVVYHAVNVYMLYSAIAARCLGDEAVKISRALEKSLSEARYKLSFIVGRDTNNLTEEEIIRATVETVAENTSDGIIAPLVFAFILGAPGAYLYKMVNTMDSMLGYKNPKYRWIGFFPAKTDDVFNFIPARLTGLLMNLAGMFRFNTARGFRIMLRDRRNHKSPNCAYPEGAVAGLLGIQLGGSNYYFGEEVEKPKIGDSTRKLERLDIRRTVEIMFGTELLIMFVYIGIEVML